MTRDSVTATVVGIITDQLDLEHREEVSERMDGKLVDALGADSLGCVEIAIAIEDEFTIDIPDEAMADLDTPAKIVDYVCTELGVE